VGAQLAASQEGLSSMELVFTKSQAGGAHGPEVSLLGSQPIVGSYKGKVKLSLCLIN
jgi:hypothetical protein